MDAITGTTEEKNVQTEYEAICANLNQLASFRFTLIGFYVAAMGLMSSASPDSEPSPILPTGSSSRPAPSSAPSRPWAPSSRAAIGHCGALMAVPG
jgi:hypothetical protein